MSLQIRDFRREDVVELTATSAVGRAGLSTRQKNSSLSPITQLHIPMMWTIHSGRSGPLGSEYATHRWKLGPQA